MSRTIVGPPRKRAAGTGKASNRLHPFPMNGAHIPHYSLSTLGHGHETTTTTILASRLPIGNKPKRFCIVSFFHSFEGAKIQFFSNVALENFVCFTRGLIDENM